MMRKNAAVTILFFIAIIFFCISFTSDPNSITKKNVELHLPKGFPKPFYEFKNNKITPEGFVLGRNLFYDPILSRDSTISCGSCHQQFAAFAHIDHNLSHGIENRIGIRNVPPLQNLIWKDNFMWDGGITHLEAQPINPITSKDEMDENLQNVVLKLQRNNNYHHLFKNAFNDTLISAERIFKSLAQFTGLMISSNAAYDRYLKKEIDYSDSEKRGLELFMQKCNSCHTAPLFTNNQFENNALQFDSTLYDLGRGNITKQEGDHHKFKIPSLRNIQVTYPYMHDGRFKNLKQVLEHYSKLSEHQKNKNKKLQAIGHLSNTDQQDIIDFLLTLTDKTFLFDRRFGQ